MTQVQTMAAPPTGIVDLINLVHQGQFKQALEDELRKVVEGIQNTGKGGGLSIKINLLPNSRIGAIEVSGEVVAKVPKQSLRASIFFPTPENNLSRIDYRQPDMFEKPGEAA